MQGTAAEQLCTIRTRVADRIGANRFDTWFGSAADLQLEGEHLRVTVANEFVGHWISANFLPQLAEIARDVIGTEPQIQIQVGSNGNGRAPGGAAEPRAARPPAAPRRGEPRAALRGDLQAFVVGPSNELAHSVASAVVRAPGAAFKHVVLHGGCGLGKTHLLQGICNGLRRTQPQLQWSYLSGEEFTNEYIYSVRSTRVDVFRARFRHVDLLVIDDIHFLANKPATQEEFLHTFNAIDAAGKVVILSTDAHPRQISSLSEPLVNRLIAAMVVKIDPPEFSVRREILRRRAAGMQVELPDEVLDYVARHITRNVRELEGALYKLAAYASLAREPIRPELARKAVEEYIATARPPEAADIERAVATHFGVTRDALHSGSRDRTVTTARGVAMFLIRRHTRLSFPEIGRLMGSKQHSTAIMAVRRIQSLLDRDGAVAWKTPAGVREAPVRSVLEQLEQRLVPDAPS